MKKKKMVNYKKIKRDILRRDMGLDSRFTTKVGKDKKKYDRNQEKRNKFDAFEEWKKRYEMQGYYSSTNYGRIPLNELENYCKIILI